MNSKYLIYGITFFLSSNIYSFANNRKNILFIVVDDLRPELNCYGASYMHTPNIDRLASQGVLFQRAYCQQSVSAPSRNSVLTGLRPDGIGIYNLSTFFRKNIPNVVTLPQHFKENGYQTEQVGKIFHTGHGNSDDSLSWSIPKWEPDQILGELTPLVRKDTTGLESDFPKKEGKMLPYYASNVPEENMTDSRNVTIAIERLKKLKEKPFFLAVGLIKPHLPFVAPKKYWDMYDENNIIVPEKQTPKNMPEYALADFGELRKYYGIPAEGNLDNNISKSLIHGYRACTSYIDAQVGRLLDAIEENGLSNNTIIILWGDHGWKLGEYGSWCKHSNMEMDVNAPLIISTPKGKSNIKTTSIVEFVDIYPTLCELAGLKAPLHLQGESLVPILNNPQHKVKDVAISQYPRGKGNKIMGYSMRTDKYRYTRWIKFNSPKKEIVKQELYDLSNTKVANINLANDEKYEQIIIEMDRKLSKELSKYQTYTPNVSTTINLTQE